MDRLDIISVIVNKTIVTSPCGIIFCMGKKTRPPKLSEVFSIREAVPVDAQGNPIRTQDPFAPPSRPSDRVQGAPSAGLRTKPQDRSAPSPTAPKPPESRTIKPQVKPPYRGTYVGQTFTTNSHYAPKGVSWQDKATGDKRYGAVQALNKVSLVWDGNDWIPQQEFDHKAKTGQLRKK